jgi:hypothetical protein
MRNVLTKYEPYGAAHRSAGFCNARLRRMDKAYCHLKRYAALEPNAADVGQTLATLRQLELSGRKVADCRAVMK